jgi:hypothetical protein
MNYILKNETVLKTFNYFIEFLTVLIAGLGATSFAMISHGIRDMYVIVFDYVLYYYSMFLEYANMNSFDVLTLLTIVVISTAFTVRLICMIRYVYESIEGAYYITYFAFYGQDVVTPKITSKLFARKPDAPTLIKTEGAHSDNAFLHTLTGMPKGVFQVYGVLGDQTFFAGHGFAVNNKLYTSYHVVSHFDSILVKTLINSRALKVTINTDSIDQELDFVELTGKGTCAALGVKSLETAVIRNAPVVVYTCDIEKSDYYQQSVVVESLDENPEQPFCIYTKSNTVAGDSGLPVMQNGKVVAMHVGSVINKPRNLHILILALNLGDYVVRAEKFQSIFPNIEIVTESSTQDSQDNERFVGILTYKELKQQASAKMSRGEHEGLDGRKSKAEMLDEIPSQRPMIEVRGYKSAKQGREGPAPRTRPHTRNWADIEEEEVLNWSENTKLEKFKEFKEFLDFKSFSDRLKATIAENLTSKENIVEQTTITMDDKLLHKSLKVMPPTSQADLNMMTPSEKASIVSEELESQNEKAKPQDLIVVSTELLKSTNLEESKTKLKKENQRLREQLAELSKKLNSSNQTSLAI